MSTPMKSTWTILDCIYVTLFPSISCTVAAWFSCAIESVNVSLYVSAGNVEMKQVHVYFGSSASASILSQTSTYHLRVIPRAWLQLLSP